MRASLLSIVISLTTLTVNSQGFERVRLRDGATQAGDGFYVRIDGGPVAARPPEWPERTLWFYVRAPRHVDGTELGDCVIHIQDGHGQFIGTFHSSPHRGDQAKEEGVFDVIVVPELAKQIQLTIEYTKQTDFGKTIAKYYEMDLRDYLPKTR
jgi:hypothetical protein